MNRFQLLPLGPVHAFLIQFGLEAEGQLLLPVLFGDEGLDLVLFDLGVHVELVGVDVTR